MGQFDQLIAQELMRNRSQRGDEPNQRARDFAARQMNARAGNAPSTAWAEANEAPVVRDNPAMMGRSAGGGGGGASLPAQGPMPMARPMDAAIDEQMGNPQLAAMQPPAAPPPLIQMGDASAMEQAGLSGIEQQIADQVGPPASAKMTGPAEWLRELNLAGAKGNVAPDAATAAPAGTPVASDGDWEVPIAIGGSGGDIAAIVASLGGAYGVRKLLQSYQAGDPDATRFFKASGLAPDDLSMFADDLNPSRAEGGTKPAPSKNSKQAQPSRAKPSPNQVQKATQKPRSAPQPKAGNSKVTPKIGPDHPKWKVKK